MVDNYDKGLLDGDDDPLLDSLMGRDELIYFGSLRHFGPRRVERKVQALCAFEWAGFRFQAQPQMLFKPTGLVIYGAPQDAVFEYAQVGNQQELLVSFGKFPARFFNLDKSFEQIAKDLEQGLEPPAWGDWDTCQMGMNIRVTISAKDGSPLGPDQGVSIGMWGWVVRP